MLPDHLILDKAIAEKRIILTSDMDFGQLLAINKLKLVSVIQFRTSSFISSNIINKLHILFEEFADHLKGHFIITIEDSRTRFRKLPL